MVKYFSQSLQKDNSYLSENKHACMSMKHCEKVNANLAEKYTWTWKVVDNFNYPKRKIDIALSILKIEIITVFDVFPHYAQQAQNVEHIEIQVKLVKG